MLLFGCWFLLLLNNSRVWGQFRPEERHRGQRVMYRGQVALLHGEDGTENLLLWRPDGEIVSAPRSQTRDTGEPFVPLDTAALGSQLLEQPDLAGMESFPSNHYTVISDTSPAFREAAIRVMESMVPGMALRARAMKLPLHAPPTPMTVIMFRKRQRYFAYRKVPRHVVAYYEPIRNQVVMCEQLPDDAPPVAASQQLATIAHEGAHQILHNIGVQQRLSRWPAWLNEGLAEYFAPTTFGKRMTWKGAGEVNDWRMYELERYLKSGPGAGEFVGDTIVAARLTSTGYATAWALTHYLASQRRETFHELLRLYAKTAPLEGAADAANGIVLSQRITFARLFGSDFAELEREIVDHLRTLPYRDPYANEPHFAAFVLSPDSPARKQANIFHNRRDAERWCRERAGQQAAKTVVRKFASRSQAESYARQWLGGR